MASVPSTNSSANIGDILSPLEVIQVLDKTIDHAKAEGDLNLYENTVQQIQENGISYQVRICPALHKKEAVRAPTPHIAPAPGDIQKVVETIVKHDPFTPPFTSLFVGEMKDALEEDEGGYYILLNKFAVVRGHFLLVTKDYQSQSDPLSPSQLTQIYLLLLAAQSQNKPYFAFFNCGLLSGASQPHKHIQFLPGEPPIERLAKGKKIENEMRPFVISSLPFSAHIRRLDNSIISNAASLSDQSSYTQDHDTIEQLGAELSMAFMTLLDEMYHAIRVEEAQVPAYTKWGKEKTQSMDEKEKEREDEKMKVEPSTPSYNVVMTLGHMYLFPRVAERFTQEKEPVSKSKIDPTPPVLPASPSSDAPVMPAINPLSDSVPSTGPTEQAEPYLSLSVNSLGFAGMLLVKSDDELEKVKKVGVGQILASVGRKPLSVVLGGKEDRGHDDVFAELA